MKALLLAVGLGLLSGCAAGRGFSDALQEEGPQIVADLAASAVERKLGEEFKALSEDIRSMPGKIPPPPPKDPMGEGVLYMAAYLAGKLLLGTGKAAAGKAFGKKVA